MRKWCKKVLVGVMVMIFAFSPLIFVGCDFGGGSSSSGGSSSGGDTNPTYNVADYLSAIKTSYTVNNSSSTTNKEVQKYAKEALQISQMMAKDVVIRLLKQYTQDDTTGTTIKVAGSSADGVGELSKDLGTSTIPFSGQFKESEYGDHYLHNDYGTYKFENDNSFGHSALNWVMYDSSSSNIPTNFSTYVSRFHIDGVDATNLDKISYAILLITEKFNSVTESGFNSAYADFKAEYESQTDYKKSAEELSYKIRHTALSGEQEIKAFSTYICDYVIGSTLIEQDSKEYSVMVNLRTGDPVQNKTINPETGVLVDEEFVGETYYYYPNKPGADGTGGSIEDVSRYYCHDMRIWLFWDRIKAVRDATGVTLWQDLDGNGEPDVATVKRSIGGEMHTQPKFIPTINFRNYKQTVSYIVNLVTDADYRIGYKQAGSTDITEETGYPVVSNVFSVDYKYTEVVTTSSLTAKDSCLLPKRAYKSMIFCAKDRSNLDVKNSLDSIYLLMESATGDEIKIDLYARYYRSGQGYAKWNLRDLGQNNNDQLVDVYPLTTTTQTINGPYSFKYVDGRYEEGCLLELDFTKLFKNARFNNILNYNTFDYNYTMQNSSEIKHASLYELKKFPENFYDTTGSVEERVKHSTVFAPSSKNNQLYSTLFVNGTELYSYNPTNLAGEADFEYIEILFATSNNKLFSFALTGYVPANEAINDVG